MSIVEIEETGVIVEVSESMVTIVLANRGLQGATGQSGGGGGGSTGALFYGGLF